MRYDVDDEMKTANTAKLKPTLTDEVEGYDTLPNDEDAGDEEDR